MKLTETLLHKFDAAEAYQLIFSEGSSPFDGDNGDATDGPSFLLEAVVLREGGYGDGVVVPETLAPRQDLAGYRLDGYESSLSVYFQRHKIAIWMGNSSLGVALFVATAKKVDELVDDLQEEFVVS